MDDWLYEFLQEVLLLLSYLNKATVRNLNILLNQLILLIRYI